MTAVEGLHDLKKKRAWDSPVKNYHPGTLLLICLLAGCAWAQAPAASTSPAANSELPFTERLEPPSIAGDRMPLASLSEMPRSNFVTANMQVSASFDDNVLSTAGHRVSDTSYLLLPAFEIGQTRERWRLDFGYSPGLTINQHMSERNQSAHSLHLSLDYRLSPHVGIRVRDNFEKSNSIFSGLLTSSTQPGPLQSPNTSLMIPLADRTGNTSGVDLTYQFSASSLVGVGGNYYFNNYGAIAGNASPQSSLIDARSAGGTTFYAHHFRNGQWAGMVVNVERLTFDSGSRSDLARPMLFYSIPVVSHVTLSLWGGPEYSRTRGINFLAAGTAFNRSSWTGAGGLSFLVQGNRTSFSAGYLRQTSDGGGLAEAVAMQQANAEVRRRLGARWTASANLGYGMNDPVNAVAALSKYRTWMAGVGTGYQITNNFSASLNYAREQQQVEIPSLSGSADRNRVFFSLAYSFSRPLGR